MKKANENLEEIHAVEEIEKMKEPYKRVEEVCTVEEVIITEVTDVFVILSECVNFESADVEDIELAINCQEFEKFETALEFYEPDRKPSCRKMLGQHKPYTPRKFTVFRGKQVAIKKLNQKRRRRKRKRSKQRSGRRRKKKRIRVSSFPLPFMDLLDSTLSQCCPWFTVVL